MHCAIGFRSHFKICTFVFHCLNCNQQEYYLSEILVPLIVYQKQLQSFDTNQLYVLRLKTKNDTRAVSDADLILWNALTVAIRTILAFRKIMKTHLFDWAFLP